jgi:hypothetical protein
LSFGIDANILLYASDTHIAALLLDHGVRTLYSHDVDLRRHRELRVIDPLTAQESG